MPLPTDPNQPWPPPDWQPIQHDMEQAAVWYGGNEDDLAAYYSGSGSTDNPGLISRAAALITGNTGGGRTSATRRFWGRQTDDDQARVHAPIAGDVAGTSADLLFGEDLSILIPEAHDINPATADNPATTRQTATAAAATAAEDRLQEIADADGWANKLLEAAEICAGIGTVYLRPVWDSEIADHPMLSIVHGDHAIPEFAWGRLRTVTFWQTVRIDGHHVWRHLEHHQPGVVQHGLYIGTAREIGTARPLRDHPATAALIGRHGPDENGTLLLSSIHPDLAGTLLPELLPNVKPDRRRRQHPTGGHIGRSDLAGSWGLLDAFDETLSSWMRDVRLGKARIMVPDEFLDRRGRGTGAGFDMDRQIFSPLNVDPSSHDKATIELIQPVIRYEAHMRTMLELAERIVVHAGFSPATFGLIGDVAQIQTATEVVAREGRTARTMARKQRYAGPAVAATGEKMLLLDAALFGSGVEPMRPQVVWPEQRDDPRRLAETVELLSRAAAMSVEARVRMAQPHLDEPGVSAEVDRIVSEQGWSVDDPTGGFS